MSKLIYPLITMTALALVLGGCAPKPDDGGGEWKKFEKQEHATIKVMYWDEQQFYDEYGTMFQIEYPNVEFEFVGWPTSADPEMSAQEIYGRHVELTQPDVIISLINYAPLVEGGKLLDLEPIIKRDGFDLDGYMPAVLSKLREEGNGKLYGLSPNFRSYGLYYNKELFAKYGIDPPTDSMTWEEILELAQRFPTDGEGDERIYGFTIDDFGSPIRHIVESLKSQNRKLLNPEGTAIGLDGQAWRKSFESIVSAIQSGAFYLPTLEEIAKPIRTMEGNRFLMGRSAMTFRHHLFVHDFRRSTIDWAVVSAPVDPLNRTQSSAYELSHIFGISNTSPNVRAAWEFVKYVNSPEFAQIKSKASNEFLLSRTEYIRTPGERDISSLYKLDPVMTSSNEFASFSSEVPYELVKIIVKELTEVAEKRKTLDDAMEAMREEGNALLAKVRAKKS